MSVYLKRSKLGEKNIRKEQNEGFKLITSCLVDQHSNRRAAICDSLFFTKLDICGFIFLFKSTKNDFHFLHLRVSKWNVDPIAKTRPTRCSSLLRLIPIGESSSKGFFSFFHFSSFQQKSIFLNETIFYFLLLRMNVFFLQMFSRSSLKEISKEALNKKFGVN